MPEDTPMTDAPAKEILSYERFGTAITELAEQITSSGWRPDIVLSIARGGMLPGGALGYALGVKNVAVVNVEFYTGEDERLEMPVMLPPTPKAIDLAGSRVLIVDDVADTGRTLEIVEDYCAEHVAETRIAVLYAKPRSTVQPQYAWCETDRWIVFPWSAD